MLVMMLAMMLVATKHLLISMRRSMTARANARKVKTEKGSVQPPPPPNCRELASLLIKPFPFHKRKWKEFSCKCYSFFRMLCSPLKSPLLLATLWQEWMPGWGASWRGEARWQPGLPTAFHLPSSLDCDWKGLQTHWFATDQTEIVKSWLHWSQRSNILGETLSTETDDMHL